MKVLPECHYACDSCNKPFESAEKLHKHQCNVMQLHGITIKRFRCNICAQLFVTNHGMKRQHSIHFKNQKYNCSICVLGFRLRQELLDHMKLHETIPKVGQNKSANPSPYDAQVPSKEGTSSDYVENLTEDAVYKNRSNSPENPSSNGQNLPANSLLYIQNLPKISFSYVQNLPENSTSYLRTTPSGQSVVNNLNTPTQSLQKNSTSNLQSMLANSTSYDQISPENFPSFAQSSPEHSPSYVQSSPGDSPSYFQSTPEDSPSDVQSSPEKLLSNVRVPLQKAMHAKN